MTAHVHVNLRVKDPARQAALAFYQSSEYAPTKIERDAVQEARMFVVDAG